MAQHNLILGGHSLQDYQEMFALDEAALGHSIIDCGSGCASFAADSAKLGYQVVACDDRYAWDVAKLEHYFTEEFNTMLAEVKQTQQCFVWDNDKSLEKLVVTRRAGIQQFINDFTQGKKDKRYVATTLTALPYEDFAFDLALSSHSLFYYWDDQDISFHVNAIKEMCRVAREARIFPLIDSEGNITPLLGPVMLALQQDNLFVEVKEVAYHLQKNGNAMLRVMAQQCDVK